MTVPGRQGRPRGRRPLPPGNRRITYPGRMKRPGPATRAVISVALWPLIIILSPVILLAGELVNRYVMRRVRPAAAPTPGAAGWHIGRLSPHTSLLLTLITKPRWFAPPRPRPPGKRRLATPPPT